jgi:hypothetical protein
VVSYVRWIGVVASQIASAPYDLWTDSLYTYYYLNTQHYKWYITAMDGLNILISPTTVRRASAGHGEIA